MILALSDFFSAIEKGLSQIKNFFVAMWELIETTIEFIPQPFLNITLIFLPIIIASILYKIIRG